MSSATEIVQFGCGIAMIIIGMAGLVGNTMSIVVMSKTDMRSSINCILVGLAIFDTLVILLSIYIYGIRGICVSSDNSACLLYNKLLFKRSELYLQPVILILQMGTTWLTVAITVERYVAVCFPLRARSLCTVRRARICVVAITLFAILYNLPRFWERELYQYVGRFSKKTRILTRSTWLYKNKYYNQIYFTWMYLFLIYVIPVSILAVLNVLIWTKLRKANRQHRDMSRQEKSERKLTMMLFCVVAVYLLCYLPSMTGKILLLVNIKSEVRRNFANLLFVTNSSVNFVIYCIFGQMFRRQLMRILRACCPCLGDGDVHPAEESTVTYMSEVQQNHSNGSSIATAIV